MSFIIIQPGYAVSVDNIPQPLDAEQNYIIDLADILDYDAETEINNAIAILQVNKNKIIYIRYLLRTNALAIKISYRNLLEKPSYSQDQVIPTQVMKIIILRDELFRW